MKLKNEFYLDQDVLKISRELLGKALFTRIDGTTTSGIITETEAYAGVTDRASHAYGGRRTKRTEIMFARGGSAYVYLCYGIHHLFNIITNQKDIPYAVLIRAIYPVDGMAVILKRRKLDSKIFDTQKFELIAKGPGTVSQALGINTSHSGEKLSGHKIWVEDHNIKIDAKKIISGPRIGVEYAKEDALLPYRFYMNFDKI